MFGTQSAWYFSDLAGIRMAPFNASAGPGYGSGWARLLLRPAVSCEYLAAALNLSSVNATMLSSRGPISSAWRLASCPESQIPATPSAPKPAVSTCALVLEKDKYQTNTSGRAHLNCGEGRLISAVTFANFGTPSGSCSTGFRANASCTDSDPEVGRSKAVVEKLCLGQQACSLDVDVQHFGSQCLGVPKRLAVQVACKHAPPAPAPPAPAPAPAPLPIGPRHFSWSIVIPGGSTAQVHVPLLAAEPSGVTITVNVAGGGVERKAVWQAGQFEGGVDGVEAAAVDGDSVAFSCGSGQYSFELSE